jgi:hypothetical protein
VAGCVEASVSGSPAGGGGSGGRMDFALLRLRVGVAACEWQTVMVNGASQAQRCAEEHSARSAAWRMLVVQFVVVVGATARGLRPTSWLSLVPKCATC